MARFGFLPRATAIALICAAPCMTRTAHAADPPSSSSSVPAKSASGVAVVAIGAKSEAPAWTLAQAVYASAALRPSGVDEAHARVLAGEAPAADAPRDLRDLADTRAAIRGDDAPSRALLGSIATNLHLRGIVVVEMSDDTHPAARVFLSDTGAFDAARYAPDAAAADASDAGAARASGLLTWGGAVASLERLFPPNAVIPAGSGAGASAPALAVTPHAAVDGHAKKDDASSSHRAFYTSPWFWGAVGAAAFGGVALYFATRDNTPDTIHLQMQVPK